MLWPNCAKRPFDFGTWVSTMKPFRIVCSHCQAKLRAGGVVHFWTVLHLFFAVGLIWLYRTAGERGYLGSAWEMVLFLLLAVVLIFSTAYVIPYFAFDRVYRIEVE